MRKLNLGNREEMIGKWLREGEKRGKGKRKKGERKRARWRDGERHISKGSLPGAVLVCNQKKWKAKQLIPY